MKTSCQQTREFFPWLINGSLETSEHAAVREHLVACEECRVQLAEELQVWELATDHIPSLALAEFAQGLTPSEMDNEAIERHLAVCGSCREELELAAADQVLVFETARTKRAAERPDTVRTAPVRTDPDIRWQVARWRRAALAASLAAVLSSAGLIWSLKAGFRTPIGEIAGSRVAAVGSHPAPAATDRPEDASANAGGVLFSDGFEGNSIWSTSYGGDS